MENIVQISFAGCGGMYHYYLGIAKVIQDNFELDNVVFGGVSGGCIPGLLLLLNANIDNVHYDLNHAIIKESASSWTGSLWRYYNIMRKHIHEYLKPNDYNKVQNKLFISLTNLDSRKNEIICSWDSNEDLINCIQCSAFIPMTFEAKLWFNHRNSRYIDGGITNNFVKMFPDKPCIYITPRKWRKYHYSWFWCYSDVYWAEELYKWGKEDATNNIDEFTAYLKIKDDPFLSKELLLSSIKDHENKNDCSEDFYNISDMNASDVEMITYKSNS
jgi:hypothetical protein